MRAAGRAVRRALGMPLLAKELVEAAGRGRTYALRTACGGVLLVLFLVVYNGLEKSHPGPLEMLGRGDELFVPLVYALFAAIYLLLPAGACGAIAGERERGSLDLLLLTDLPPTSLVVQKYLAQLIPVLSCLLMALPLLTAALALGGVEPRLVRDTAWLLTVTALHVCALTLAVSACCATTGGAFSATYLALGAFTFGGAVLLSLSSRGIAGAAAAPPLTFAMRHAQAEGHALAYEIGVGLMLATIVPLLLVTRLQLPRAVRARRGSGIRRLFEWLDGQFRGANVGDVELGRSPGPAGRAGPLAWREEHRRALDRWRYVLRWVLALGALVTVLILRLPEATGSLWLLAWALASMVLMIAGTGLLTSERAAGTLDLLLVTPLTGQQIVDQKLRGLDGLVAVLAVPLMILSVAFVHQTFPGHGRFVPLAIAHLCLTALLAWVLLRSAALFGFHVALRVKDRLRATLIALIGLGVLASLPRLVLAQSLVPPELLEYLLTLLDPPLLLQLLVSEEYLRDLVRPHFDTSDWVVKLLPIGAIATWAFIAWKLREKAGDDTDPLLGRPA